MKQLGLVLLFTACATREPSTGKLPAAWQAINATDFVFRGPDTLRALDVQGIDSNCGQLEDETLSITYDYGGYSQPPGEKPYETLNIDGRTAYRVVSKVDGDPRPFTSFVHFPDVHGTGVKLTMYAYATTEEAQSLAFQIFDTIDFRELDAASYCKTARDERVLIDHYRVPCAGLQPQWCYLVNGVFGYEGIEGLNWQPRHRYDTIVHIEPVQEPLQDASCVKKSLKELLSDTEVPRASTFGFTLPGDVVEKIDDHSFTLVGERITCATAEVCTAAFALGDGSARAELTYAADDSLMLLALGD